MICPKKFTNNAENVGLRLIQDEGLTIRSRTEPESAKLVLKKGADNRLSVFHQQSAKRRDRTEFLYPGE